jgi:putative nucleotidyltransferase with HDIG domain
VLSKNRFISAGAPFLLAVVTAGTIALALSIYELYHNPPDPSWLLLVGLTLLSGSFTIKVPSVPATISVSETFVFTCVLLFGGPAATVTVVIEALIMSSWRHRRDLRKVVFNATEPALSIWVASHLFALALGQSKAIPISDVSVLLIPVIVLCLAYFFLNSTLAAIAVSIESGAPVIKVWQNYFFWLFLNYLAAASIAVLIAQNSETVGVTTLGIILPLLVVSYLTMKSAMGRVEDANNHVANVNRLYLSTIETLAMAVDAKDQVTHGHVRRVQAYAVALARILGLRDSKILSAIEASALLHDMGKLAVPEHILNKPGKLTPSEFEQIKLHASVGADILSSIDFPYPVVPIVRHHHENWDGTGYPDGLRGQEIPIGARILSVVDCFDALTSDRPYRRRISSEEALVVLQDRSGTMYDPLVVDTFAASLSSICADEPLPPPGKVLPTIGWSTRSNVEGNTGRADYVPSRQWPSGSSNDSNSVLTEKLLNTYLSGCFRDTNWVLYTVDHGSSDLVAFMSSPPDDLFHHVRIPLGKGVSGWVAANRQSIIDSDAALDLGTHDRKFVGSYCMSAPIIAEYDKLLGVLTIYGRSTDRFTERDRAVLELAAFAIATALTTATRPGAFSTK